MYGVFLKNLKCLTPAVVVSYTCFSLQLLRPEEIELLVCGSPKFDMEELREVTTYDGFKPQDKTIRLEALVLG